MSSDAIRIDDSFWPVVIVEPMRVPSSSEVSLFVRQLEQLAQNRQSAFSVLLDTRRKVKLSPAQRKQVAEGFKQGAIQKYVRAEAVLLRSSVLAFFGRIVLAIVRPKFTMGAFGDYDGAFAWAKAQAEQ